MKLISDPLQFHCSLVAPTVQKYKMCIPLVYKHNFSSRKLLYFHDSISFILFYFFLLPVVIQSQQFQRYFLICTKKMLCPTVQKNISYSCSEMTFFFVWLNVCIIYLYYSTFCGVFFLFSWISNFFLVLKFSYSHSRQSL